MRLRLAPGKLHYWDPKTRLNLWASTCPEGTVPEDADLSNIRLALATGVLVRVGVASSPAETKQKLDPLQPAENPLEKKTVQEPEPDKGGEVRAKGEVGAAEPDQTGEGLEPEVDGDSAPQAEDEGRVDPDQPDKASEPGQALEETAKEPEKPKKQRKKGGRKKKQG